MLTFIGLILAHDDGQGVVISLEIIRLIYEQQLRPRRTIRAVLFTDEEQRYYFVFLLNYNVTFC